MRLVVGRRRTATVTTQATMATILIGTGSAAALAAEVSKINNGVGDRGGNGGDDGS